MRIAIQSLQDDRFFLRPLRLISGLFYEESEVCFAEKGDLVVDISITGEDIVTASAALTEMSTGNVYRETFAKDVSAF
ncbi:hypothetical protein GCM10020331_081330 [Ectobacillus funiculus]